KILDPGMALVIGVLASGGDGSFNFGMNFGPKVSLDNPSPGRSALNWLIAALVVLGILFIGFTYFTDRLLSRITVLHGWKRIAFQTCIYVAIGSSLLGVLMYVTRNLDRYAASAVPLAF